MPFVVLIALHAIYGAAAIRFAPAQNRKPPAATRSRIPITLVCVGLALEVLGAALSTTLALTEGVADPGLVIFAAGALAVLSAGFPGSLRLSSRVGTIEGAGRLVVMAAVLPLMGVVASMVLFALLA